MTITIDGPSASGKSTVAQETARYLGIFYLNTGLLYRCLAYGLFHVLCESKVAISPDSIRRCEVIEKLKSININSISYSYEINNKDSIKKYSSKVCFKGVDITEKCYNAEQIDQISSRISAIPEVRTFLLDYQRVFARQNDIVVDGRDCGSVVFAEPAVHKFYLTASIEVRAMRRLLDDKSKSADIYSDKSSVTSSTYIPRTLKTLDTVISDLKSRDHRDMSRAISPLCVPLGAVVIDSSYMTMEEVVRLIADTVAVNKNR